MAGPEEPGSPAVAAALLFFRDEAASATASRALYEALRTAKLVVPIVGAAGEAKNELDIGLVAADDARGDTRLLAFNSERTFRIGGGRSRCRRSRASHVSHMCYLVVA